MKKPLVVKACDKESYISEGCFITELSNSSADPDLSIAQARVPPGVTTRWHRLTGTSERYLILDGEGVVEIDDMPGTEVQPGDVVLIPANSRQRITNNTGSDLVFLALCTPRFKADKYSEE
jgi:mannose-6-phosphate isomerase-like protein (cupin superfamily)